MGVGGTSTAREHVASPAEVVYRSLRCACPVTSSPVAPAFAALGQVGTGAMVPHLAVTLGANSITVWSTRGMSACRGGAWYGGEKPVHVLDRPRRWITSWELWSVPRHVLTYVLVVEVLALGVTAATAPHLGVTGLDGCGSACLRRAPSSTLS